MPRMDVAPDHALLVRVLRDPRQLQSLSAEQFSHAIDSANHARLLGWLVTHADSYLPLDSPAWLNDRLVTARALVREYERAVRWEIDRLTRAFWDIELRCILLKGAAYLAAGLPPGRGRRVADIDVLVPRERLPEVEKVLLAHGWQFGEIDPYDAHFYRQ